MKKFYIAYDTDVGIKKKTNQDSLLLKGCSEEHGETLLIAICDGMGGMEKGELASATVVRAFSDWFEQVYIKNEMHVGEEGIRQQWQSLLEEINGRLIRYGKENQIQLGTTISVVLLNSDGQYMLCHVGDTRIYTLSDTLQQLTEDHTFIAREIKRGNMTIEEAKKDNRIRTFFISPIIFSQSLYNLFLPFPNIYPKIISRSQNQNIPVTDTYTHKSAPKSLG